MALSYRIDAMGIPAIQDALEYLSGGHFWARDFYDEIGNAVVTATKEHFETETAPDGTPWAPLKSRAGKILSDTGRLAGSFTHEATDDYVDIGTNLIYGALHHFGGVIVPKVAKHLRFFIGGVPVFTNKVTVPSRPIVGDGEAERHAIEDVANRRVLEIWQGAE